MKRKVDAGDLRIGMYVTELDRPWLETPFLFQGFYISNNDELRQIRDLCKFVYVDTDPPEEDHAPRNRPATGGKNAAPVRDIRDRSGESGTEPWDVATPSTAQSRREYAAFRKELPRAWQFRNQARDYIDEVLQDIRLGNGANTQHARAVVNDLVTSITTNANASLWLTNLRQRHEYTAIHSINVCILSIAFGRHLGFAREHLELLGLGALLHDVGKMRTPVEILDKPGPLTKEEFEVMKRHPVDGYELVRKAGRVPQEALDVIRYHHERLSGNGYPEGLKGDQLSTAVLVVALVDTYDAITSDRVHQNGIPAHHVLTMMHHLAPNDFGRELMEEFINCIGIYPVGSAVRLSNGALGVVMAT
ncbi:MAG: HD-GYP domain-containing protein, partial [Gammaproteobacteria bacterium]